MSYTFIGIQALDDSPIFRAPDGSLHGLANQLPEPTSLDLPSPPPSKAEIVKIAQGIDDALKVLGMDDTRLGLSIDVKEPIGRTNTVRLSGWVGRSSVAHLRKNRAALQEARRAGTGPRSVASWSSHWATDCAPRRPPPIRRRCAAA